MGIIEYLNIKLDGKKTIIAGLAWIVYGIFGYFLDQPHYMEHIIGGWTTIGIGHKLEKLKFTRK